MGNAGLYWWPHDATVATLIDLGKLFEEFEVSPAHKVSRRDTLGGRLFTTVHQGRRQLFAKLRLAGWDASVTQLTNLRALEDHLNRGGWISVTTDIDKAWAGYLQKSSKAAGVTVLRTLGNPFWNQSATIAVNDVVSVFSPGPAGRYQESKVTTVTNQANITVTPALHERHEGVTICRFEGFFPFMTLGPGSDAVAILSSSHRHIWTLELNLLENPFYVVETGAIAKNTTFSTGTKPSQAWQQGAARATTIGKIGTNAPTGKNGPVGTVIGAFGGNKL